MAAITWADVSGFAAELDDVPLVVQDVLLEHVNTELSVAVFGGEDAPKLKLARIYLAAHMATLSTSEGDAPAGPLVSETADNISRTYAARGGGRGDDSDLDATPYGRMYRRLVRTSAARFPRGA